MQFPRGLQCQTRSGPDNPPWTVTKAVGNGRTVFASILTGVLFVVGFSLRHYDRVGKQIYAYLLLRFALTFWMKSNKPFADAGSIIVTEVFQCEE